MQIPTFSNFQIIALPHYRIFKFSNPITQRIKDPIQNDKALIQPIGERFMIEEIYIRPAYPHTSGYHQAYKANIATNQTYTRGERIKPPNE
jgi:hypothetical protein